MNQEAKLKRCKMCPNKFRPYRSTDRYCSPKCAAEDSKAKARKPLIRTAPKKVYREPPERVQAKRDARVRDGGVCKLRPFLPAELRHDTHWRLIQVHHIIFLSEDGVDDGWNLITLCGHCHHEIVHKFKKDWQHVLLAIVNGADWYEKIKGYPMPEKVAQKLLYLSQL